MTRPLRRHQQRAYAHAKRSPAPPSVGLFMRPGTGKTLTAIRITRETKDNGQPFLVCCRRDDFLTWELELEREGYDPAYIAKIESSNYLPDEEELRDTTHVLVTWDLIRNKRVKNFLRHRQWRAKIGDELHLIKRHEAARTRAVLKATAHIPVSLGLTGTPITNAGIRDLYTQMQFIAGPKSPLGTNFWSFLNRFFIKAQHDPSIGAFGQWFPKRKAKADIQRLLKKWCFYVHEDDALPDLPPRIDQIHALPLSGMQRRHYDAFLQQWESAPLSAPASAANTDTEVNQVIVQLQKLRQICQGFFYVSDGPDGERTAVQLRSSKLQLLQDLTLSEDGPYAQTPAIVLWCTYTHEIQRYAEALQAQNQRVVTFYGGMSRHNREIARRSFLSPHGPRWFIANVDMGLGMNELVRAPLAIYASNSDRHVSRDQSELRTRRIGSEHHKQITYVDLIAEDTIEERQARRRLSSAALAQEILSALKHGKTPKQALEAL